jgi:hypothetical protein
MIAEKDEVVIWVVSDVLKESMRSVVRAWNNTQPTHGPHPVGELGPILHTIILVHIQEKLKDIGESQIQHMMEDGNLADMVMRTRSGADTKNMKTIIALQIYGVLSRSMTHMVQQVIPVNKRVARGWPERARGWSVYYTQNTEGQALRALMLNYLQPLHGLMGAIEVRTGVDRSVDRHGLILDGPRLGPDWAPMQTFNEAEDAEEEVEVRQEGAHRDLTLAHLKS